jgi:hypothetical protein
MENILTLNQSIFGTKSRERRISRRALKASVQELYIPEESDEITYDEGYDIDGGVSFSRGWLAATIDVSIAGLCLIPGIGSSLSILLGIKNIGRFFGKSLAKALFKKVGNAIISGILCFVVGSAISYIDNTAMNVLCSNICNNLFSSLSFGGIVSMAVDAIDGAFDGMITF